MVKLVGGIPQEKDPKKGSPNPDYPHLYRAFPVLIYYIKEAQLKTKNLKRKKRCPRNGA
jgi:hypothetical protein